MSLVSFSWPKMIRSGLYLAAKGGVTFILGYFAVRWLLEGGNPFTAQQVIENAGAFLLFFFFMGTGLYAYSIEKTYINLTVIKCVALCFFVGLSYNILMYMVIWPDSDISLPKLMSGALTVVLMGVYLGIVVRKKWPNFIP